ncbi:metallophosphoesterase [Streptomyces actuosus]|uniref:Metallophosphoesterase n=1 Tax=Streptomyces actuosus TaxID=1885 RepID=A0ABS2VMQ0_STRAS|nr:metallophosphoesterase [Streptomyces actuosus]MBN0044345.1 metallophosphoesterase [Streptomyces actuosus]
MIIVFLLVALLVLAVLGTANLYLWRRLFRDTTRGPGPVRRAGAVLLAAGWGAAVGALVAERTGAPFLLQRVLAWPGFLWLALSLYLLLAVLAGEVLRPLLRRLPARRTRTEAVLPSPAPVPVGASPREPGPREPAPQSPPPRPPADPTRRLFVSRVVAGAAAAAAVGTVGYGTYGVLRGPSVKRVTVPLAKLPRAAHGYRIAVVSDIHLSPVLGRGFAQKVVDTINATRPDLIAVVGDLVDGSVKDLGPAAAPLTRLTARHGSFFVTGNHEYFSGAAQWVEEVRHLGLHPLENARTELPWFDLAGVNDVQGESEGRGPDFARALGDRDTARACVLLAHQPVQIHEAVRHGVDLQLSGHTHGGQLWPGNLIARAANPTVAGLERYGDTQLYVSRGAGAWGPPTRVGAPSDITVIELASLRA